MNIYLIGGLHCWKSEDKIFIKELIGEITSHDGLYDFEDMVEFWKEKKEYYEGKKEVKSLISGQVEKITYDKIQLDYNLDQYYDSCTSKYIVWGFRQPTPNELIHIEKKLKAEKEAELKKKKEEFERLKKELGE